MKFTLSWLHQHLKTQASASELCQKLNQIGLEVESVEQLGAELKPFLTARIEHVQPHPDADRLQVCEVNAGPTHQRMQVVCGAANARQGLCVVFAPVGTVIPQSGIKIKKGKIRGQVSEGMLCSLEELGQADSSDGIAELPADTLPGESYADFLNIQDVLIDISITPNRGDALSVRGIARDLSAAGMGELRPWLSGTEEGLFPSPISWDLQWKEAAPWVLGRVIRGVTNKASPSWMQKRLVAIGLRPINLLVDITNYFCFDLGRPFHAFDLDKLSGKKLTIRRAQDEEFLGFNDKTYHLGSDICVISDDEGVQSIAGIMGAKKSGVTEETKNVFIECALFDPVMIATSSRKLSLATDSSVRFERGVDPALPPAALQALTEMVVRYGGGEPSEVVSAGKMPHWQRQARLHFASFRDVGGGCGIAPQSAIHELECLGFEVAHQTQHYVDVHVPSWRNDIAQTPILAVKDTPSGEEDKDVVRRVRNVGAERDLLEEVLRLQGLDSVPAQLLPPLNEKPTQPLSVQQKTHMGLRRLLAERGCVEIVGFSFVSQALGKYFGTLPPRLKLLNPIASDQAQMRPSAVINLLLAAQHNDDRGRGNGGFFELGPRFTADGQELTLSGLRFGHTPRYPHHPLHAYNWLDSKADVVEALELCGIKLDSLKLTRDVPAWYHPGRSGALTTYKGDVVAYFGELHPVITQAIDSALRPAIFEIFLDRLPPPKKKKAPNLSSLQPITRDFSFLFPRDGHIGSLLHVIKQADRHLITDVQLFDIYEGEHVPKACRSVSVVVTMQPQKKNLTDKEIDAVSEKILAKAQTCQATLRQ